MKALKAKAKAARRRRHAKRAAYQPVRKSNAQALEMEQAIKQRIQHDEEAASSVTTFSMKAYSRLSPFSQRVKHVL